MDLFFDFLSLLDDLLWTYISLAVILFSGIYFTISSKFFQFRSVFKISSHVKELIQCAEKGKEGLHPIKLYFASVGGMVGIGNIVTVMAAVTMGGPGSLVWLWMASFCGMLVKYSEIYLGIKYRVSDNKGGYNGGPMYYLQTAFGNKFLSYIVCILLCIYGAEVAQFLIVTDTIVSTTGSNRYLVIGVLLVLVMLAAVGGVSRLANICSTLMPPFIICYVLIGLWVIFDHAAELPSVLKVIVQSAFSGHAPVGGFVGSTILLAAHYGVSRAVYSGDIGIGYDSTVQSETQTLYPERQARMAIFGLFTDSFICTITILIALLTGVWQAENLQPSEYISVALSDYIAHIDIFTMCLFFVAAYTTIVGYLVVGQKCAQFISPKFGKVVYIIYSMFAFIVFSFQTQEKVILVMSVSGGLLMLINILGVFKLRKDIKFL
ncbi:amino acid carrier protein [Candidatus Lariskella endosymbiont of Epinotia ramella]|uniref:amino acid carrier protein n=1 Tax=Candidatus Lariskella endosymbiont of Epinotia ramella TaxID=3066224 RepID=UPI0030D0EE4A